MLPTLYMCTHKIDVTQKYFSLCCATRTVSSNFCDLKLNKGGSV